MKYDEKNLLNFISVMVVAVFLLQAWSAVSGPKVIQTSSLTAQVTSVSTSSSPASTGSGGSVSLAPVPSVIPTGIPSIYGVELGISFDDVSASNPALADQTIRVLGNLDRELTLDGADLQRYIDVVMLISCEYCCGAESIIFKNGQPACGCAHSYAMRGVAKYLIINHSDEYTDAELLEELGKWKTLFFPGQITQKAVILQEQGVELNYINLASNKYRGIESGSSGSGMVGGC